MLLLACTPPALSATAIGAQHNGAAPRMLQRTAIAAGMRAYLRAKFDATIAAFGKVSIPVKHAGLAKWRAKLQANSDLLVLVENYD
ncbi:hypothetical protein INH39_31345 [Massilia violaceinigra]|uniref:Uncharacterized protein n=1 Tax=Massilia violaceinigra TaxID=2045208 RepID=A0ABY4A4W6_9BURK|nr:hypothetical protein [Massilia violaceinigra]UOD29815.1 hypothetical protein INH39_31345 [Massilia violaceinigra]